MRFAEPWALLVLVLVPLALLGGWLSERRRRELVARAGDAPLLGRLVRSSPDGGRALRVARTVVLAVALGFAALSLARPQFGLRTEIRKARGMDVVIALDLSRSMLARDVVPSRLERARIELTDLMARLGGDRIGLVGFTSIALPLSPLTIDHAAVGLQLRSATPDDLPRGGTSISAAIQAGLRMLESAPESSGAQAIVIVTDGEEHEGDPEAAARAAAEAGVEVHVVGVGSRTGEPIPLTDGRGKVTGYLKDRNGQTVISRLGASMLRKIAAAGSGLIALPGEQGGLDLSVVRNHLSRQKKAELTDRVVRIYEERYRWFLLPAALLLLIATLLRPSRRVAGGVSAGLLALALPSVGFAQALQSEDPDAASARRSLAEGKGDEAVQAYKSALDRLGDRPELLYNLGLAEAARGEMDEAVSRFEQARGLAPDPRLRARASFALGNTQRALKKYDEAIQAYRKALLDDPTLTSARRNLELSTAMKAVAAAQPKPPGEDGEPNEDQKPPEDQDGGVSDGGQDAGPPDAGPQDGSDGDGGGETGEPDAGTNEDDGGGDGDDGDDGDGGSSEDGAGGPPDAGTGEDEDGGSSGGSDGGQDDAGGSARPNPGAKDEDQDEDLEKQKVEQLLDALQEQEKALERERLKQKYKGRNVEKDW